MPGSPSLQRHDLVGRTELGKSICSAAPVEVADADISLATSINWYENGTVRLVDSAAFLVNLRYTDDGLPQSGSHFLHLAFTSARKLSTASRSSGVFAARVSTGAT